MNDCARCGNCCKSFDIEPSHEDFLRWVDEDRTDIIEWVYDGGDDIVHDYVFHSGLKTGFCPFLSFKGTVAHCEIHETKPKVCKEYPLIKPPHARACASHTQTLSGEGTS